MSSRTPPPLPPHSPPAALPPPSEPGRPAAARRRGLGRGWWISGLVLLLILMAVIYYVTGQKEAQNEARQQHSRIQPVVASKAWKGDIGVTKDGLGSVTPLYSVTVKTRVDGQLMQVYFKEGQMVNGPTTLPGNPPITKPGDPLVDIDPRPYQAQLDQAEGQLVHDEALLKNAQIDYQRYETLWKQDSISQQTLATQEATVAQDEGTVQSDEANVEADKLNIEYCHITAPLTGLVGLRLVDPGNQVHAADTNGLLVINQVQPITVIFTVAEDDLPPILQQRNAGQTLEVDAYNRDFKTKLSQGTLLSIDNQIDPSTGTVKLRATFPNQDNALFPNQFVNARLLVETKQGVTLVPPAAIQRTSDQPFVYLVKEGSGTDGKKGHHHGTDDGASEGIFDTLGRWLHLSAAAPAKKDHGATQMVTVQPVTIGVSNAEATEIEKGLSPGDLVVIEGVDKLQEGAPVTVQLKGK